MADLPGIGQEVDVREASRLVGGRTADPSAGSSAAVIVDVRERSEMIGVRPDGAIALPLSEFAVRFRELPTDRLLLVLCATGKRSALAARHLARHGYRAVSVTGGSDAWVRAGLPVRRGPLDPDEGALPKL